MKFHCRLDPKKYAIKLTSFVVYPLSLMFEKGVLVAKDA